ncbi:hypothetical protein [Wolbachia endosymbiont (group A) of Anthophora plumipes]
MGFLEGYIEQIGKNLQLFTSIKRNLILRSMIAELIKIRWKISKLL